MSGNCFWYEDASSKPKKTIIETAWIIMPILMIVGGIYLNIRWIRAESMIIKIMSFLIILVGVFLLIIHRVMHPSRGKKYLILLDGVGNPFIVDITSLFFLRTYGLEKYKMIYRSGSSGRQLSAEIENNRRYKAIVDYIYKNNLLTYLSQNPVAGGEKIECILSIWRGSYYFTIAYKVYGDSKTRHARFYNDIYNYDRLYEKLNVMYHSTDHKEAKNKVFIGIVCMVIAAILLPVVMILSTKSPSIALNVVMLMLVFAIFGVGLALIASR